MRRHGLREYDQARACPTLPGRWVRGPTRLSLSLSRSASRHILIEKCSPIASGVSPIGALEDEILRCAELYRRIGIRRGDVVTVQLPNRIEFPVAFFALELIGAIANKVNPDFRARELDYILKFSGSSAYVFRANFVASTICRWRKASVNRYPVSSICWWRARRLKALTVLTNCDRAAARGRAPRSHGP